MRKKLTEIIKKEIAGSKNLDGKEKLESLILLDTASEAIKVRDNYKVIQELESLYKVAKSENQKEALREVIRRYKREIRILSHDTRDRPLTVKHLLEALGDNPDPDMKLTVGIDDGMGYAASGFHDVIEVYEDDGEIRIWM